MDQSQISHFPPCAAEAVTRKEQRADRRTEEEEVGLSCAEAAVTGHHCIFSGVTQAATGCPCGQAHALAVSGKVPLDRTDLALEEGSKHLLHH